MELSATFVLCTFVPHSVGPLKTTAFAYLCSLGGRLRWGTRNSNPWWFLLVFEVAFWHAKFLDTCEYVWAVLSTFSPNVCLTLNSIGIGVNVNAQNKNKWSHFLRRLSITHLYWAISFSIWILIFYYPFRLYDLVIIHFGAKLS